MSFSWRDGILHVEDIPVPRLADEFGTPLYLYSRHALHEAVARFRDAFAPLQATIQYAVKANSNPHLLREFVKLGLGMDVVSGGELEFAWLAGASMDSIAFAGVGKTDAELMAALDGRFSPISDSTAAQWGRPAPGQRGPAGRIHVESRSELARLRRIARELRVPATFAIRINPKVDAGTHEYTTTGKEENKFGVPLEETLELIAEVRNDPFLRFDGLHAHIGSPVTTIEPYLETVSVLLELARAIESSGIRVRTIDLGGGWPVPYRPGESFPLETFARPIVEALRRAVAGDRRILLEPGRYLVAQAGLLVTRVTALKSGTRKRFVVVDSGMHTLLRPALYGAFHALWPVTSGGITPSWSPERALAIPTEGADLAPVEVVGPLCETGDFLARDRLLPPLVEGELLAIFEAGAYGMSMSSNYNLHGRPAEVLVDRERAHLIRRREALADLLAGFGPDLAPRTPMAAPSAASS